MSFCALHLTDVVRWELGSDVGVFCFRRGCECHALDPELNGSTYNFGCGWSTFYSGCKFTKSTGAARKFKAGALPAAQVCYASPSAQRENYIAIHCSSRTLCRDNTTAAVAVAAASSIVCDELLVCIINTAASLVSLSLMTFAAVALKRASSGSASVECEPAWSACCTLLLFLQEPKVEESIQNLVTDLSPLCRSVAPDAFKNMVIIACCCAIP